MSTFDSSVDLLSELDNVSRIHTLERKTIDEVMLIMAKKIVCTIGIERMSVWLLNQEKDALVSMGEYDRRDDSFKKETTLRKSDFPDYFDSIEKNQILYAQNVHTHPATKCLNSSYNEPNDIITLLDIPLRLEGKLIGVMCYEKTGAIEKLFSNDEKSFAFSVSIIFVSNIEARYRRTAQRSLEKLIEEKELLIREMNHRVKNNFSILISLLRINKNQGTLKSSSEILEEYQQRIFSMMQIHNLLFESGNYHEVNIGDYLTELGKEFRNSHPELNDQIHVSIDVEDCVKDSKSGLYIGLVITEIFLNAIKHGISDPTHFSFSLALSRTEDGGVALIIGDNGKGFLFETELEKSTLGLSLIRDLLLELEYPCTYPNMGNGNYEIRLD